MLAATRQMVEQRVQHNDQVAVAIGIGFASAALVISWPIHAMLTKRSDVP